MERLSSYASMALIRFLCAFALAAWGSMPASAALMSGTSSVVTTDRVRAELLAHAPEGVAAGKPLWVALQIAHQPEWHTYWKNSGDSGLPTQLQWTLPPGIVAGDIAWPVPRKIPIGRLANYGYEGTVLLPVPLTITPEFQPGGFQSDLKVQLKAQWLVCKRECIPEEGSFSLSIPLRSTTALNGPAFEASFQAQPKPVSGESRATIDGQSLELKVAGLPAALRGKKLEFFPEVSEVIETAADWAQRWQGETWTARVPLSPHRTQNPAVLPVVLTLGAEGWRTEAAVSGVWPPAVPATGLSPALQAALHANAVSVATPAAALTLGAALLGALLGGLILNLMPCVFPILAMKVVGFTRQAADRRGHRAAGLAYTAGVVVSFLALGGLMLGLRAAGEQLGWGFQLQSPLMVAALAALFTLIALNLAGLFELGHVLPSRLAALQARHPVANAFLSGMLAVAVASPCTAPFMGASLGFAVGLPAAQALLVFGTIGLGMALPYLAASASPALALRLPRPGPWMDTFRKLMAFPMFATVAWLVWVLGQQSGIDGAGTLLGLLVTLSMMVWAFTLRGRTRGVFAAVAGALLVALAWAGGASLNPPAAPAQQAAQEGPWQPWTATRVEQLLASGQPVFVDFTAAWCITCQYNKRATLDQKDVLQAFATKRVALLRADWTRRDPAITAALAQLGRNGVPVYVLYKPGDRPVVLTEVLDANEMRSAIARL